MDRDLSVVWKNFNCDSKYGGEGVENMGCEQDIRYRFSRSNKFVLDFVELDKIAVDRLSGSRTQTVKLSQECHSSDDSTGRIHSCRKDSPHFSWVADLFQVDLNYIGAGSTDDHCCLRLTVHVVDVDGSFSHSGSSKPNRIVRCQLLP
jgi:hypothetical protein